jgi:hypothetical protein
VKVVTWFAGTVKIGSVKAMRSLILRGHQPPASCEGREQRRKDCGKKKQRCGNAARSHKFYPFNSGSFRTL